MRKAESESVPGKIMECVLLGSASEHVKNKKATRDIWHGFAEGTLCSLWHNTKHWRSFHNREKKNLKKKLFVKKFENVNKTNYFTPLFREMYLPSRLDTIDALKQ